MRDYRIISLAVGAIFVFSTSASAVKLTNMDKRSYDVSIDVDGKSKMLRIAPGATLERLCSNKACKLKLVDVADGVYTLEGNETVKIDGALVYYADAFVSKEGSNATLKDVKPKVAPKTDAPSQK